MEVNDAVVSRPKSRPKPNNIFEIKIEIEARSYTWISFFLLAPTQNFSDMEKTACKRDPKAVEPHRGP